jgi:transketolase C-terminal domain/subunit
VAARDANATKRSARDFPGRLFNVGIADAKLRWLLDHDADLRR